ncbi:DUF2946 family protein [Sphingosinicella rhizophila]|uniref:DUF2946 domain-containing protein n=1 Tax=Sphingosinicella rhizophila TaxID=3050082 RepID=A0ABU3QC67_9SPHN|nr:DUF2946 family protein [Sphingosinicella sp. GR2756]MDT9600968.1 hypothetical protein [Sphingosinicella sp. GR2756]
MHLLRRLLFKNRWIAGAILALALMMKVAMPAGFMPTMSDGQIIVSLCSGTGPTAMVMTIPGLEHGRSDSDGQHGKTEQPCAFSGLSAPSLAAADPGLLAAAILFILALGMRPPAVPATRAPPYLRPPLRGPPAIQRL